VYRQCLEKRVSLEVFAKVAGREQTIDSLKREINDASDTIVESLFYVPSNPILEDTLAPAHRQQVLQVLGAPPRQWGDLEGQYLSVLYRQCTEGAGSLNISDWWTAYCESQRENMKVSDPDVLKLSFILGLKELAFLGIAKRSNVKAHHITRTAFV